MTDTLAASRFQVPEEVQASQARRDDARNRARQRPCAGDGGTCRRPAQHSSNARGGAYCAPCWGDARTTAPCGCPQHSGRRITDPVLHHAWHTQALAAGLPPGPLDATTLRLARGSAATPARTVFDVVVERKGQRASGALRDASRGDG